MRKSEADTFYDVLCDAPNDDSKTVQRQAFAGLLWSKQFYMYDVDKWLRGDPAEPTPPPQRNRNTAWRHLNANDIIIMPDTWEYPMVCGVGPGVSLHHNGLDRYGFCQEANTFAPT